MPPDLDLTEPLDGEGGDDGDGAGSIREYMIVSGGFTDRDWVTFPVWAYDMDHYDRGGPEHVGGVGDGSGRGHGGGGGGPWYDLSGLGLGQADGPREPSASADDVDDNDTHDDDDDNDDDGQDDDAVFGDHDVGPTGQLPGALLPPPSLLLPRGECQGGHWAGGDALILYGGLRVTHSSPSDQRRAHPGVDGVVGAPPPNPRGGPPSVQIDTPQGDVWAYRYDTMEWTPGAVAERSTIEFGIGIGGDGGGGGYPRARTAHAAVVAAAAALTRPAYSPSPTSTLRRSGDESSSKMEVSTNEGVFIFFFFCFFRIKYIYYIPY